MHSTHTIPSETYKSPGHSVAAYTRVPTTATHSDKPRKTSESTSTADSGVALVRGRVYTKEQVPRLRIAEAEYPGIEFSTYYSNMTVGNKGGIIRGEGIQLRIPPKAISKRQSRTMSLQGCIDGPFQLPEDVHLTSLITCSPHGHFQHEVTLTLHHLVQLFIDTLRIIELNELARLIEQFWEAKLDMYIKI